MRIIYLFIIYFFPFLLFGSELEWQAEFRYRLMQDRSTSNSENTISEFSTYSLLRSRIFFKLVNGPVSINMQLQDSRILGDLINSPGIAGEDQTKPTFHQVYVNTHNILRRNWSVQLGRFQLPLGQQRIFSKNNWNNIGRSFEGFLTYRKSLKSNLRLFYLINNESYDRLDNDLYDQTINGFYFDFSLKQLLIRKRMSPFLGSNIEVYGFRTGLAEDRDGLLVQNYYRTTYGSRIYTSFLFFTFEAEAALQSGRINGGHVDGFLSAVNFGAKLDFLPLINFMSIGNEFISGDDESTRLFEGFAKPFGAGHKWHGHYDYSAHKSFKDNYHVGLKEWNVKAKLSGLVGMNLNVNYHNFRDAVQGNKFGEELDLIFSRKLPSGGDWSLVYALYWENGGDAPLDFTYLMISFIL